MKFKIVRSKFFDGLKKVQNIVGGKGSLLIIQNVLIEAKDNAIVLTTTDMDMSIRSRVPCEVVEEGATTLPVKLLVNAIAKSPEGNIEIEVGAADCAFISAGSAEFKLNGLPIADFPKLPEDQHSFEYVLPQLVLREMLRKTAYAASQDDTRKTLKGVFVSFRDGKVTMVATDGRRLALVEHELEIPEDAQRDIVLPTKVVTELQRSLGNDGDVRITIEQSQICFNMGDTRLYSKLIDEIYPNYRQVIPNNCNERVLVDRQLLLNAIDRVSVLAMDEQNSINLTFNENQLIVASSKASEAGSARDIVPIKYDGPHIDIVFNPGYLMDPLKAIDEDEVAIELKDGTSPALVKCSIPFLYVMMPLRIS